MAGEILTCAVCAGPIEVGISKTTGLPHKTKRKYCSRKCHGNKPKKYISRVTDNTEPCMYCCKPLNRRVRSTKDSGKFCSRECAFASLSKVSAERDGIRRIARAIAKRRKNLYRQIVLPEVAALRRIAANVAASLVEPSLDLVCFDCGVKFEQRTHMGRPEKRCRSCKTALARLTQKAGKVRRKFALRGRDVDRIDPIRVFERDRWKCHICGTRTLKSKRGTHEERAPELEHIVSLSDGGTHTWGNVACSCRKCNINKGANSTGQIGFGFSV